MHSPDEPGSPRALTGSWPALAAWGAGLVQLAIGAGMVTGADAAPRGMGAVLVLIGAAALGWGVPSLARSRVVAPRCAMVLALGGVGTAAGALVADPARVSVVAAGAALTFWVSLGVFAARGVRGGDRAAEPARPAGLVGILLGAVVVAGVVTPALGATEAGRLAPDHSGHRLVLPGGGHGH
jgi:hypothetical protein